MSDTIKKQVPAYSSFTTMRNFWDLTRTEGVPPIIDASVTKYMSGSSSAQLRTTHKYLRLTDENGATTPELERLVYASDEERPKILSNILKEAYTFLFNEGDGFQLEKGTFRQFDDKFREQGATGATVVKAERFFLQAAEYAGIPISQYIIKGMKSRKTTKKPTQTTPSANNKTELQKPTVEQKKNKVQEKPHDDQVKHPPSGVQSQVDPRYKRLIMIHEDLPQSGQWTQEDRDNWIGAYTSFLDYLVRIVEEDKEESYEDEEEN